MPNENLEKLVQYARDKKPVAFKELLHTEIGSRMSTKISDIKTNLSKTMFQTGKKEVELDEGKMKDLSMRIDRIVANLKKNRKTKEFADKFKKDVTKTMDIEKSLENVLPGYKKGDKRYWAGNLDVEEGYSSSQVKKAIKIAHDMGGNMTGAVKKIERIKRGLSDDEAVEDALKSANEAFIPKGMKIPEGSKEEYQKFFNSKLAKYKVKSPAELDDAQKKKFFNEIEKEWKADDE